MEPSAVGMTPASGTGRAPRTAAEAARDAFLADHPGLRFAPVVACIAALDEAESIGATLDEVPETACGLPVEVLVVDDGSSDRTAEVASEHGAYVARLPHNQGHGVALRLAYELASKLGAEYVVTLDADGQWNPTELPRVLEPVVDGEADFAIGSRILGATETDDRFRHLGVHVFAKVISAITGTRVTDTSSGFRAMRVELTQAVPQVQVQYQTSELLIGAIARGYRIAERPVVMRRRLFGTTKKGHNVLYGMRYARVIFATARRDRRELARARRTAKAAT